MNSAGIYLSMEMSDPCSGLEDLFVDLLDFVAAAAPALYSKLVSY